MGEFCLIGKLFLVDRDNDLHRLLFMPNGLPDGAKLAYYVKGQVIYGYDYHVNAVFTCGCL